MAHDATQMATAEQSAGEGGECDDGPADATRAEAVAAGALTAFVVVVGLLPFPFLRVIEGGVGAALGG